MKRTLAMLLLFLMTIGLVPAVARAEAQQSIVFATQAGKEALFEDIAQAYEAETGVKVIMQYLPKQGLKEAMVGPLAGGSAEYDIVYLQDPWLPDFIEAGFLAPLDDYLSQETIDKTREEQISTEVFDIGYYDGHFYGFPWDVSTFFLFYRTDLIETPPATMDEYLELSKQFTQSINPDSPTRYGTVMEGSTERVNYQEWYNFLWSWGGSHFDENGKPTINSQPAIDSLRWRYNFKLDWNVVPPDVGNYQYPEVNTAFQEGLAAMVLNWNSAYGVFSSSEQSPNIYDKFDVAPLPAYVDADGNETCIPFLKAWYLCVPEASENKQLAADFIVYFMGYEPSKKALLYAPNAGNIEAWNDPEVLAFRGDAEVFKASLEMGRMTPALLNFSIIEDALAEELAAVLAGKKTPEEALNTAQSVMEQYY